MKEYMDKLKFKDLTTIQKETIKFFNSNMNIVGLAQTGTGKTHAYLLPILSNIKQDNVIQVLIIVPTNELVIQVTNMLKDTTDEFVVKSFYGSIDLQKEEIWLKKRQPDIVITTPQKLDILVNEKKLVNLSKLKYLVLDEADMMFDESFFSLIDRSIHNLKIEKYLLFSATLTKAMEPFIKKYFGAYHLIDTTSERINLTNALVRIKSSRLETLHEVIKSINPYLAIIFISKNDNILDIYKDLVQLGLSVAYLSSILTMKQRKKILSDIHDSKYQYLIASDLASRGIDFKCSHVINFDLPYHLEYFKHRSGRTARMNSEGIAITIYDEIEDKKKIDKLRNKGIVFSNYSIINNQLVLQEKRAKKTDKTMKKAVGLIKKKVSVAPNYKKKYQKQLKKVIKQVKNERYRKSANNRKSR